MNRFLCLSNGYATEIFFMACFCENCAEVGLISDNSSVLLYPGVTERLMYILNMARWASSNERKDKAHYALIDYLIPKHTGNARRLLPEVNYYYSEVYCLAAIEANSFFLCER